MAQPPIACAGRHLFGQAVAAGCTSVGGDLLIAHTEAASLVGLEKITSVGGTLFISGNGLLTNLSGLESVTTVGGLQLVDNPVLSSLAGLSGLVSVTGRLRVLRNPALLSVAGLRHLTSIGGRLELVDNIGLSSLEDLSSLATVGGLQVEGNDALPSAQGLLLCQANATSTVHMTFSDVADVAIDTCRRFDNSYRYVFDNKAKLEEGVNEWVSNREVRKAKCGHINTWNTSGVTDMSGLFQSKTTFNDPIFGWDTSAVTAMEVRTESPVVFSVLHSPH